MDIKKKKILVALSGGVDSSVVLALLKQQGFDCVAVYMNLWADPTVFGLEDRKKFPQNKCCSLGSLMFARSIAQRLDTPFYSINFEEAFKSNVVDFFLDGFRAGETPNPCVRCNKTVKFGVLFKKMEELGCDYLATGHYARLEAKDGLIHLYRGKDGKKDQTYFLYNLTQTQLKKILFPLGQYNKEEVKALAQDFGLKELENKRESQGVCFYPEKTYFEFLKRYLKPGEDFKPGEIQNQKGELMGHHAGLPFYTIGQRKGIGIGGGPALYASKLDKIRNTLMVGSEDDLLSQSVRIRDWNFLCGMPKEGIAYEARVRSLGKFTPVRLKKQGEDYQIEFERSERAIMPGQSLVLYKDGELIGGGIMSS